MSKIIIGIHGLGNKPPKDLLTSWWHKSICEGLKKVNRFHYKPNLEVVYWADILHDKPLNNLITDPENPYYLDEPYTPAPEMIHQKTNIRRKKFLGFLEDQMDRLFLNEDLSSNFDFFSEMIFKKYFKELEIYYSREPEINDASYKSVKDIIRNRLSATIRKHKGKEIFLVAHSMGSIIAYDVCSISVPDVKIDTFVTMGSPLGIPIIISKIAEELKARDPKLSKVRTPENISKAWLNFSDIQDNVALNYNLRDDYEESLSGIRVKDMIVTNNYMINNERNPHKSYGYLRAPEFSIALADFLERDVSSLKLWFLKQSYELKEKLGQFKFFRKGA